MFYKMTQQLYFTFQVYLAKEVSSQKEFASKYSFIVMTIFIHYAGLEKVGNKEITFLGSYIAGRIFQGNKCLFQLGTSNPASMNLSLHCFGKEIGF